MDFLEKLDFLMDKFDLTKTSLSQKSGIPYTTIDAWYKKGYEGLKLTTLRKLATYFNTTLDYWFLDDITDPNYGKSSGFKVDYNEMEYVKKYRALDPPGKTAVDFILENETQRIQTIKILTAQTDQLRAELAGPKTLTRYFSYYGKIAAAGKSFGFDDIIAADVMELPITDLNHDADYLIGVSGDSMEPDYHDGDIVYVKKTDHLDIGEIGIFQKDNGIYIKEVGEIGLVSRNEKYKPIVNGGNVTCLGRVIGKVEE